MDVEFPAFGRLMRTMLYNRVILIATLILSFACAVLFIGDGVLWASHIQTEPAHRPPPYHGANTMPKVDDETLKQRFEQAKEAWDERQKENRARKRREKAQADARRRTLIGDMVLDHVQTNPHEHDRLMTPPGRLPEGPQRPRPVRPAGPDRGAHSRRPDRPLIRRRSVPSIAPVSGLPSAPIFRHNSAVHSPCCVRVVPPPTQQGHIPMLYGDLPP